MNIVTAMTRNVYEWSVPFFRSLAHHNPDARVFIVCEDDVFPIELPIKAECINVSNQKLFPKNGPNYHNPYSYINLVKVAYADILPVGKVLHLDIDTIINESLEPLFNTDLTDKWFAAVPEYRGRYKPFGDIYFNAGVILINLHQMRVDGIIPRMVDYLNTVYQPFADQDAWNRWAIEQDKAVILPVRWNENFATGETNDPAIVHFCGIRNWWTDRYMPRVRYLDRWRC